MRERVWIVRVRREGDSNGERKKEIDREGESRREKENG